MVIQSFRCRQTEALFQGKRSRRFVNIEVVAMRELAMLHRAATLDDLRIPPSNRLESLHGDRSGQYSIRINQEWRLCFTWSAAGPGSVEIVDYH